VVNWNCAKYSCTCFCRICLHAYEVHMHTLLQERSVTKLLVIPYPVCHIVQNDRPEDHSVRCCQSSHQLSLSRLSISSPKRSIRTIQLDLKQRGLLLSLNSACQPACRAFKVTSVNSWRRLQPRSRMSCQLSRTRHSLMVAPDCTQS